MKAITTIRNLRFPLGQTVATPAALAEFPPEEILEALRRHASGDWKEMDPHDQKQNERAAETGEGRILSAYTLAHGRLWVITEADRSVTTILRPEDY